MGAPSTDSLMNRPPVAPADVAMPVPRTRGAATLSRLRAARPAVTTEAMLLAAAIYLTAACNGPLWRGLLAGRPVGALSTWGFAVAVGTACASATFVLLAVASPRALVK